MAGWEGAPRVVAIALASKDAGDVQYRCGRRDSSTAYGTLSKPLNHNILVLSLFTFQRAGEGISQSCWSPVVGISLADQMVHGS